MGTRPGDPSKVRVDALRIAVEKEEQGCDNCAENYLRLARRNGAEENDVLAALASSESRVSRRLLLKWSAVSVGAALGVSVLDALPGAAATTYNWGSDTSTQACSGIGQDFYIGKAGGGTSEDWLFNTSAASAAGPRYSYIYWDLHGAGSTPSGSTWSFASMAGPEA